MRMQMYLQLAEIKSMFLFHFIILLIHLFVVAVLVIDNKQSL